MKLSMLRKLQEALSPCLHGFIKGRFTFTNLIVIFLKLLDVPTTYHSINNYVLENVFFFKDLGVLINSRLSISLRIEFSVNKSVLTFIKRWIKEFNGPIICNFCNELICIHFVRAIFKCIVVHSFDMVVVTD